MSYFPSMSTYILPSLSPEAQKIRDAIRLEGIRDSQETSLEPNPANLESYAELIVKALPYKKDILPMAWLEHILKVIDQDSHLPEYFPEKARIVLALIPFSEYGSLLSDEEIEQNFYLKLLVIMGNKVVHGFGLSSNYVHLALPQVLQEDSFEVPSYESSSNTSIIIQSDRARLKSLIADSFQKFKTVLEPALNAAREKIAN